MSAYAMWNGPPHPGWAQMLGLLDLLWMGEQTEEGVRVRPSPVIPRFRDIYPVLVDGEWELHLLTRAGEISDYLEGVTVLRGHEAYIEDEVWSLDGTYRTFRYRVDQALFEGAGPENSWPSLQERFDNAMAGLAMAGLRGGD